MTDAAIEDLAGHFAAFAATAARRLPLYHRLAEAAASEPEVVALLLGADPQQRRPTLLFAAVHDVLLAGAADPLADWYPSLRDDPRTVGGGPDDPWPHFRRLALSDPGVAERVATRSTQTNEVGRCATLRLALAALSGTPLALIEVGASGGLNLLLDRYGYDYQLPGGRHRLVAPDSTPRLSCTVRGEIEPPIADLPPIASRVGLDLSPVDLRDPAAARWLMACLWPDQPERIVRLRAALAVAASDPPLVRRGDAVTGVGDLVAAVPAEQLPVVVTSWALAYLTEQRQRAFLAELDRCGAARDLSYVFAEYAVEVPGLPIPAHPSGREPDRTTLGRIDWRSGVRSVHRLADQHEHGAWVRWLA